MRGSTRAAPSAGAAAACGPDAAARAVAGALATLREVRPALVVLFTTVGSEGACAPAAAAAGAQAAAGEVPVVGLTSGACIGPSGLVPGCVALALGAPVAAGVGLAEGADADPRAAGRAAAAEALAAVGEAAEHRALLLLLDTRSGDQADTVAGAYDVAGGAIPLAGGAAAGDPAAQIARGRALQRAVVAVALGSPRPIGVGVADGCRPRGVPSIVTRSAGRTILELDGRPAADVYLEKLGRPGADPEAAQFADLAAGHPLAQPELSGDVRLRHVLGRSADGGLLCATQIPANAAVHFTTQEPDAIVESSSRAVCDACAPLQERPPAAAIVFDCAGRKHVLGDQLAREAASILRAFGPTGPPPIAGLYTRGEIGRVRGAKGDRNHAAVVVAIG